MYEDPLYLVNYLYAGLLATEMFDGVERDPSGFPNRYADLLRRGFYASPEELLRSSSAAACRRRRWSTIA